MTPAEICGIKIEGNDQWKTIIYNTRKEIRSEKEKKSEILRLISLVITAFGLINGYLEYSNQCRC